MTDALAAARRVMRVESQTLGALADRLGDDFSRAVALIRSAQGRVIVTGMGKSGIVARKIAATLASTGTPALFLHPAEAVHGDLGVVVRGDIVVMLSQSGETAEILALIDTVRRLGAQIVALTGNRASTLGREADVFIDTAVDEEGCPLGLAPMASTTGAVALGDALAAALMVESGFDEADFARLHPGGRLGKKLARVCQLMHAGAAVPRVAPTTPMREVVVEMSRKRLGCTTVVDPAGSLVGLITDGDLRRLLERDAHPLDRTASSVMTPQPLTIGPEALASVALRLMEDRKVTMLPVVSAAGALEGVVQIHDLWGTHLF